MAERDASERLNAIVDAILAGRATTAIDADVAMLAAIAADLRDLPNPEFKSRLRRTLMPNAAVVEATPRINTLRPYLVVPNGDDIIKFIESAFGGETLGVVRRPDRTVMHAEIKVGDSFIELGSANETYPPVSMAIHLYVDNADEVYESALAAGARSLRPMQDQFYGDREGSVIDSAGNHWYIATHQATGSKPPGFATVTPFIHVRGTDRLMDFLKNAFGAEELERFKTPDGLVAHGVLRFGESVVEMGEVHGEWKEMPTHVHLFVPDADAVFDRAVAAGATVLFPVADQPYGERGGGVTDPFGNQWFMATPK